MSKELKKYCKLCDSTLPLENFSVIKSTGQIHSYCKPCAIQYRKDRYAKKDYDKKYYKANKEKIIKYQQENYEVNKDKINARCRKYYENNKEQSAATNKLWRDANKEKVRAYTKVKNSGMEKPAKCTCCKRATNVEYHHHGGYDDPLKGLWVCRSRHRRFHKGCLKTKEIFDKLWEKKYGD